MKLTFTDLEDANQAWHDLEDGGLKLEGPRHAWMQYEYRGGPPLHTIILRKYWKATSAFRYSVLPPTIRV